MASYVGFVEQVDTTLAYANLLLLIRRKACGNGETSGVIFTGTGDGSFKLSEGLPSAVAETFTLTCTDAATQTFSVVGSVSGALADLIWDAAVATYYLSGPLRIWTTVPTVPFVLNDQFTFSMSAGNPAADWVLMEDTDGVYPFILKGKGYSGIDEIYVGFSNYGSVSSDYYNIIAYGFTGYVPGNTMATQPGARWSAVPTHNQRIDYWLDISPQRIAAGLKVGTPVYESFYVGKCLPYARPSQFPYPMVVAGMLAANTAPATRYSDTAHTMPYKGKRTNMALLNPAGSWLQVECFPWNNDDITGATYQVRDTSDNYPLQPVVLSDVNGVYGELEGIYYVPGFNNVVENTFVIAGVTYVVIEDVYRTGFSDYYALRLS